MTEKIAVIGGGTIGSSMPILFALGGYEVISYNRSKSGEEEVKKYISDALDNMVEGKAINKEKIEEVINKITYTNNYEEVMKDAFYIQECLPENYEVKREFVKEFDKYSKKDAVLGSSTSGLLITEIQRNSKKAENIIGAHPYTPPHIIPLIEISKGELSSNEAVKKAKEIFTNCKKEPIVLNKEAKGFVANRLQVAVLREVIDLVNNNVVSMEDADKALTFGPGIRWGIMGPGLVFELGGGKNGIEGLIKHIGPSMETWLEDMATWSKFPEGSTEKVTKGVKEEIKNRDENIGNTHDSLLKYRDEMLISLLKLHGKF